MANPIVSGLTQYVDENKTGLIQASVLGAKSAKMFNLMSDVKGPATINLLDTDIVFQADSCGWNNSGTSEISQRVLTPTALKVNMSFCDKNLLKTWKNYEVKMAAGQKTLPFEEDFIKGITEGVAEGVEKMIYQGSSANTNEFSGLIEILTADVPTGNTYSGAANTAAYAAIKNVYSLIPERALKEDTVILVDADMYRKFIQELVAANLYHFEPSEADGEYFLPGTNVKVVKVNGLNDTATNHYIIAGRLSNIFYGISGESDTDTFDSWYSKDNDEFRVKVEFIAGVQVAYPNEIVLGKVAKA